MRVRLSKEFLYFCFFILAFYWTAQFFRYFAFANVMFDFPPDLVFNLKEECESKTKQDCNLTECFHPQCKSMPKGWRPKESQYVSFFSTIDNVGKDIVYQGQVFGYSEDPEGVHLGFFVDSSIYEPLDVVFPLDKTCRAEKSVLSPQITNGYQIEIRGRLAGIDKIVVCDAGHYMKVISNPKDPKDILPP